MSRNYVTGCKRVAAAKAIEGAPSLSVRFTALICRSRVSPSGRQLPHESRLSGHHALEVDFAAGSRALINLRDSPVAEPVYSPATALMAQRHCIREC